MATVQENEQQNLRNVSHEVKEIERVFNLKTKIEHQIASIIQQYEDDTGLKIDRIRFYREGTVPIREGIYTELTITVS